MSQITSLLTTLKRELKARGITYAEAASRLDLSESSVKRLFSESRLSLERLEALCKLVGWEISDLVQTMAGERRRIDRLTEEQEREVAADPKLLLVAICVLNQWTFDEIIGAYRIDEHECIRLLARLDRLKLVELLPGNRFRLVVSSEFRWIPNGPIQRFFRREVQPAFLQSHFAGPGEKLLFQSGMLSRASNAALVKKMEKLLADFNELHAEDAGLPLAERFGSSILVAMRPWEFGVFSELRRKPDEKRF